MKSFASRPARFGAALALVLGGAGITALTSAGPASADPGCNIYHTNYGATPGQSVWGSATVWCVAWLIPLPVAVYQDGTNVASGMGRAEYFCQGTTVRHYGISYYNQPVSVTFDAACG